MTTFAREDDDAAVSGDTLTATVSGFFVERLLTNTVVSSDALVSVATLSGRLPDAAVTSDSVVVASDKGGFVVKFDGDTTASGETIAAHMVVALTISDGAVSSDLFSKPRIPRLKRTSGLSVTPSPLVPVLSGGAERYAQLTLSNVQTVAQNTMAMTPQAATAAPATPLDGMVRLARSPWRPVSGQTVDAWVYFDAALDEWVYQGTAPTTT